MVRSGLDTRQEVLSREHATYANQADWQTTLRDQIRQSSYFRKTPVTNAEASDSPRQPIKQQRIPVRYGSRDTVCRAQCTYIVRYGGDKGIGFVRRSKQTYFQ